MFSVTVSTFFFLEINSTKHLFKPSSPLSMNHTRARMREALPVCEACQDEVSVQKQT